MYQFSDSDSKDSDEGIRFKTESIRNKSSNTKRSDSLQSSHRRRSRHRSKSPRRRHRSRDRYESKRRSHKLRSISSSSTDKADDARRKKERERKLEKEKHSSKHDKIDIIDILGPKLPPKLERIKTPNSQDSSIVGPALPPNFNKKPAAKTSNDVVGPVLPPHLRQKLLEESLLNNTSPIESDIDELDEESFGPMPMNSNVHSKTQIALEERALQLKLDKLTGGQEKQANREEWMLALPDVKVANLGLGPRQFRGKAGPDLSDRTSWTDTPEEKAKRKLGKVDVKPVDLQKEAELKAVRRRDKEQEAIAKKHKKSKESLVEIHRKKSKKEESGGPSERRPFNRDTDLQVNRFDDAQKKAMMKKAALLDDRFSRGQSKFL